MLDTGTLVDGYRIERVIGTGRMGTVYLARNPDLPRYDALKVIHTDLFADPGFRDRFTREADIAAGLSHPNIVTVYRRGTTSDGVSWIAMQYVEGTDADTALHDGTMTPARAVYIVGEIAKALDYAHRRGVIHRDIKPANFLIAADDGHDEHVLLADFGIAGPVRSDTAAGSPRMATVAYAAPEVLRGDPVDGRADLYSLGCSLFRLLTGRAPYPVGEYVTGAIRQHLNSPPPKVTDVTGCADLPEAFNTVIARAMAKDPDHRYQSGRDLAAAAAAALHGAPTRAARHPDTPTAGRPPAGEVSVPIETWNFPAESADTWRPTTRTLRIAAAAAGAAALSAAIWGLSSTSHDDTPPPANTAAPTTTSSTPLHDPDADAALQRLLPAGYSPTACSPTTPTGGARATVACTSNRDRGGPPSARYSLMPSVEALRAAFDGVVGQARTVVCPGNVPIMSPGPWRRNANPEQPAGTVFCGIQGTTPIVAWTTDDRLLLNVTTAADDDLDALYNWWSSHS